MSKLWQRYIGPSEMKIVKGIKIAIRLIKNGESRRVAIMWKAWRHTRKMERIAGRGGLTFKIIQIVITLKCTLRCSKCASLMQYYKNPEHTPAEQVYRDLDLMMGKIDYTVLLNFVGGETFLVKDVSSYVSYAVEKHRDKFGMIVLVTNGTIVPSEDELKKLAKFRKYIYVRISDYGEKSTKMEQLQEALRRYRILFIADDFIWRAWQQLIDGESKSERYAENVYRSCIARNDCNMVLDGKFYHCGFLMSGEALRTIPYSEDNHVDILSADTTKEDIIRYKSDNNIPPGCRWCSGQSEESPIIPKAEQAREPVKYKIY